ncbi:MAG TPA: DUF4292 domain-containing protein [Niabella sp.]|nr:DUF4292 domain-containing protein [Niabella sp.]HQW14868.1 DUF4292 domain-containing protein [Niabella sp.]HQX18507.1 DUF4292 domain-containing protein [Niabella sp.]HQX42602.1 DUF4292 domain-containing protein [Niabella sp.]HRB06034.1 DUF4292 domain-containing protein [Niabella sp.]
MKDLFIVLTATMLFSCSAAKKIPKAPPVIRDTASAPIETETPASVIGSLNHIDFKTFSGKADVDFDDGKGNQRSLSAKLVMIKDNAIWISAGLMGFEGVRVLITKDSVKMLNKLEKEYTASSLAYLQDKIGLPADFETLQNLLIGNAVFVNKENATMEKGTDRYVVSTQSDKFKNVLTVLLPGYLPSVSQLTDTDETQKRTAQLDYADYRSISGRNFSALRNISVKYKNNIKIKLNYRSADFDGEVSIPFTVPSSYKVK